MCAWVWAYERTWISRFHFDSFSDHSNMASSPITSSPARYPGLWLFKCTSPLPMVSFDCFFSCSPPSDHGGVALSRDSLLIPVIQWPLLTVLLPFDPLSDYDGVALSRNILLITTHQCIWSSSTILFPSLPFQITVGWPWDLSRNSEPIATHQCLRPPFPFHFPFVPFQITAL